MDDPFWCQVVGSTRREDAPCAGVYPPPCAGVCVYPASTTGGCISDIEGQYSGYPGGIGSGFGFGGGYYTGNDGTQSSTDGNRDTGSSSSTFWSEAAGVVRREDDTVHAILPPSNAQRRSREARQSHEEDDGLPRSAYYQPRTPSRRYPLPEPAPPERSTRDRRRACGVLPGSPQTLFENTRPFPGPGGSSRQRPYVRGFPISLDGNDEEDPSTDSQISGSSPRPIRIEASRTARTEQHTGNAPTDPFSRPGIRLGTHPQVRKPPTPWILFQAQTKTDLSLGEVTHKRRFFHSSWSEPGPQLQCFRTYGWAGSADWF